MFLPELLVTEDKSYFTDRLFELTGRGRRYWAHFPTFLLRRILRREEGMLNIKTKMEGKEND